MMEAPTTLLEDLNKDMSGVVELVRRSLVQVSNGRRGAGAGVVWREDGLIITNAHVVRKESPEVVLPDGRTTSAKVLAMNPELDLAALQLPDGGLEPIAVRATNDLSVGEWVFALGHPWGVEGAATGGVVIGYGAQIPENPRPHQEWIAVNLPLRPGHSGGALVDSLGRLIGINAIMSGPSVGLAIPAHVVEAFLQESKI
jgi:serine protease Do